MKRTRVTPQRASAKLEEPAPTKPTELPSPAWYASHGKVAERQPSLGFAPMIELPMWGPGIREGWLFDYDVWVEFASTVITNHKEAIKKMLLPQLDKDGQVRLMEIIALSENLHLAFDKGTPTEALHGMDFQACEFGVGDWFPLEYRVAAFEIFYHLSDLRGKLIAAFVDQNSDERSALEWCQLLMASEEYSSKDFGDEPDQALIKRLSDRVLLAKLRLHGRAETGAGDGASHQEKAA